LNNKAVNIRRLILLGATLVFILAALAPSPAAALEIHIGRGCPNAPEAPFPASPLPPGGPPSPPDGGPPPDGGAPPDGGLPEGPNMCEIVPDCDPESQSCPGVPETPIEAP
jgi:hypothetical protein